jgi:uncharacterized RDD family membrane protein YckC
MDQVRYAGFWIRAVADFLDSIVLDLATCLVALMALGGVYWMRILFFPLEKLESPLDLLDPFLLQFILVCVRVVLSLFYYTLGTYWYGTTLGKRFFKVYVVSFPHFQAIGWKQSLIRFLGYGVSYLPFFGGFLMVAFHPHKRGLHDLIAGTVSIIKPSQVD